MRLDLFENSDFDRGRSRFVEVIWVVTQGLFLSSWLPGSAWRVYILRLFGAHVSEGVVIKPGVKVKFPWKLTIGKHTWVGEDVWIDNLAHVTVGDHCCISQGAYLCTGNHRWDRKGFDLETKEIVIEDQAWVGAKSCIAPGSVIKKGCVISMGGISYGTLEDWQIHTGSQSSSVKKREIVS